MKQRQTFVTRRVAIALLALTAAACAGMDRAPRTVLVAGATGGTGALIVKHLQRQGYQVRALVRDVAKAKEQLGPDVQYLQGDVKDPATLITATSGVAAVISSIGAKGKEGPDRPEMIDYEGVRNLVDAAKAAKVQQFVLVSSRGVTHEDNPLNGMFGNVLIWKLKGENYLRASGVPYTVVRPGGLLNEPPGRGDIAFEQGDRRYGDTVLSIAREDVAIICVEALKYPESKFRTFEIHRTTGALVPDWQAKFASLKPDSRL